MMSEFLGSIHFNKNNDLLISSSNLTLEKWHGRVIYIPQKHVSQYCCDNSNNQSGKLINQINSDIRDPNLKMISYKAGITRAKWFMDNERFLIASELGHLEAFRITNQNEQKETEGVESIMYAREHDSVIDCLETLIDQPFAITGSNDSKIKVWDLEAQLSTRTYKAHDDVVCGLSLKPEDEKAFISCSLDGKALIWDTRKPKPAFSIRHHLTGYPSCSGWGKPGTNIFGLGSETGQVGLYDIRLLNNEKPLCLNECHSRSVRKIEFNKETNRIATASEDGVTNVFKFVESSVLSDAYLLKLYTFKYNDYVSDLCWTSANEFLASSWDGTLRRHLVNETENSNGR